MVKPISAEPLAVAGMRLELIQLILLVRVMQIAVVQSTFVAKHIAAELSISVV